ncbi:MAG TPA: hypothetical protein VL225_12040 [Vicinamibacterales bacterium]|jgi:hypothetical protein|nr:hypothetical protein [Vicinamibacterales bacterium]
MSLAWFLLWIVSFGSQIAVGPSGHWEGTIQAPGMEIRIEVDITRNRGGSLEGTLTNPSRHIKALPFAKVTLDGASISFYARDDQGFTGVLSTDGRLITGDFSGPDFSIPFSLTRTGDAKVEPPAPKSARIGKELEGAWTGTLDDNGISSRLVLTLANQPDGSGAGAIVMPDMGNLRIPIVAITQKASRVTFDLKAFGTSFAGALNAAGTELAGTYTNAQGTAVPLTFRRAAQ